MAVAVFLDRDGTLVRDVPYNFDPRLVDVTPDVVPALRALKHAGFQLIVVSNQSGIGRGYVSAREVDAVNAALRAHFASDGLMLSGIYYCPHTPDDGCACRKPQPGLLLQAAEQLQIDVSRSWMIGDILDDVEAGLRAGCRSILLNNGGETEWRAGELRTPHGVAADLLEAARIILCRGSRT